MPNKYVRLAQHYPDDNFLQEYSEFSQDFKINDTENGPLRGIYYSETHSSHVFLGRHETMEDIINTCVHETLHGIIVQMWLTADADTGWLELNIEEEHNLIRNHQWCEHNFSEDTYFTIFEGQHIKPNTSEDKFENDWERYNLLSDELDECLILDDEDLE